LSMEVESRWTAVDEGADVVSELHMQHLEGELEISKLQTELENLKERLEGVEEEKREQQRGLDEQEAKLQQVEDQKQELQGWFEAAKAERQRMREQFAEKLRAHREGLAEQRRLIEEQKEEQDRIVKGKIAMKKELMEVMRELKKATGEVKRAEYETQHARLDMLQDKAHLKAHKARLDGRVSQKVEASDDLHATSMEDWMQSDVDGSGELDSTWGNAQFEAPTFLESGFGDDPFAGEEFESSDEEPVDLMSQLTRESPGGPPGQVGNLMSEHEVSAGWQDQDNSSDQALSPVIHNEGWGEAFQDDDEPLDESPPPRKPRSPDSVPKLQMDRLHADTLSVSFPVVDSNEEDNPFGANDAESPYCPFGTSPQSPSEPVKKENPFTSQDMVSGPFSDPNDAFVDTEYRPFG